MSRRHVISQAKDLIRGWLERNEPETYHDGKVLILLVSSFSGGHYWTGFFKVNNLPGHVFEIRFDHSRSDMQYDVYENNGT